MSPEVSMLTRPALALPVYLYHYSTSRRLLHFYFFLTKQKKNTTTHHQHSSFSLLPNKAVNSIKPAKTVLIWHFYNHVWFGRKKSSIHWVRPKDILALHDRLLHPPESYSWSKLCTSNWPPSSSSLGTCSVPVWCQAVFTGRQLSHVGCADSPPCDPRSHSTQAPVR